MKPSTPRMPTVKHGGGGVVLWAWFAANGTGALQRVNGTMKKEVHLQIDPDDQKSSAQRFGLGRKHKAKVVMGWLNQARNKVVRTLA